MKTGETWTDGSDTGIAVVYPDAVVFVCNRNGGEGTVAIRWESEKQAASYGWYKTHESDGTPVKPEPRIGQAWLYQAPDGKLEVAIIEDAPRNGKVSVLATNTSVVLVADLHERIWPTRWRAE